MPRTHFLTKAALAFVALFISACAPPVDVVDANRESLSAGAVPSGYALPTFKFATAAPEATNQRALLLALSHTVDSRLRLKAVRCSLNNLAIDCSAQVWSITSLNDGDYVLKIEAEDSVGQKGSSTATVRVDTVAPTISFLARPSAVTSESLATMEFLASDALSGVASTQCSLDGASFAACASPARLTTLSAGDHAFRIRATDRAGNVSAEQSVAWKVTPGAPAVQFTARPRAVSTAATATFSFSAAPSSPAIVSYECSIDGGSFSACSSPRALSGLGQGRHTFALRGKTVGGATSSNTELAWVVDSVGPAAPVITTALAALTNQPSGTLSFTAADASSSIKGYQCALDGAAFKDCASPLSVANLTDGNHSLVVKAFDVVDNVSATSTYQWTVDTVLDLRFTATPALQTLVSTASFAFASSEAPANLNAFRCQLDAGATADCTSPRNLTGLSAGTHAFRVTATDRAGNTKTISYAWTVGTSGPIDGAALYEARCASCHNALATSTKVNKTSAQIAAAIQAVADMKIAPLQALTANELTAIETALKSTGGEGGGGGTVTPPSADCATTTNRGLTKESVRRLTRLELQSSVLQILPELTYDLEPFFKAYPEDDVMEEVDRYNPLFTTAQTLQWAELVDGLADAVVKRGLQWKLGGACLQQGSMASACWQNFFTTFGKQVYRRPLTTAEVTKLTNLATARANANDAIYASMHMLFRSPAFLFHYEQGGTEEASRVKLTQYEIANRISFAIIGSPPDATLLAAADAGQLQSLTQVETQARRLVALPAAKPKLERFFTEWLLLNKIQTPQNELMVFFKDLGTSGGIEKAMKQETLDYLFHIILKEKGTFQDLMTKPIAFPRWQGLAYSKGSKPFSSLADVYGGDAYSNFTPERQEEAIPFPAPNNPGLLLRAGFLSTTRWDSEPIARGVFAQRRILCEPLPSPDFSIVNSRLEDVGRLNPLVYANHEIVTAQTSGPACIGCHGRINPMGFALESFDTMGKARMQQEVLDINQFYSAKHGIVATHALPGVQPGVVVGEKTVTIATPAQLVQQIADSTRAKTCLSTFVFRHFERRHETSGDSCAIAEATRALETNQPVLDVFIKTIANEDVFWRRK